MELVSLARKIQERIDKNDEEVSRLEDLGNCKALALMELNKQITIKSLELENGVIKEFEGLKIPHKLTDRIRTNLLKGLTAQYQFEYDIAESNYKSSVVKIEANRAAMNGHQSQFRNLSEM